MTKTVHFFRCPVCQSSEVDVTSDYVRAIWKTCLSCGHEWVEEYDHQYYPERVGE